MGTPLAGRALRAWREWIMAEITETTRGRILALARDGRGRNEICRELGVSHGVVSDLCRAAGMSFDRVPREVAQAARADAQTRRSRLILALLGDVELARAHMRDAVNSRGLHDCARAVAQLCAAHAHLVRADRLANDASVDTSAVDGWISWIAGGTITKGADDGSADTDRDAP